MTTRRWLVPLVVLSLALLFGAIEGTGRWLRGIADGLQWSWGEAAQSPFSVWLVFALLTPFPAWMAQRFAIDSRNWPARVPLHVAAATAFCVTHLAINGLVLRWLGGSPDRSFLATLTWQFGTYFAVEVFIYWGIVGSILLIRRERELRVRELAAERMRGSLREATLEALRAKLHPHFLYNTLNAISVMALKGETGAVSRAVGHLGALLRSTLDEDLPQRIPLARELELLDRYVEIQRLRFPDRLRIERRIGPDTFEALVPSFVLQPLVENAVQHGLADAGGGWVRIAAGRSGDRLEIEVTDGGPGFPGTGGAEGIGLAGTRARLEQLHGAAGELVAGTGPAGGGRVLLRIPFERAPAPEARQVAG